MKQKTLLASAITTALMLHSLTICAQDATPNTPQEGLHSDQVRQLAPVTVTGSRIRSVDMETAQPLFIIDRAEIQKQGFVSVGDILSHMTNAGSAGINKSTVQTANDYAGGSYVDLRGLGLSRTLVLVDGRRWGTNTNGFTDLDTIPSSMIQRVEVLKDGASAIYGSDAIAGVINIITRTQYDGAEANVYFGKYGQGDGTNQQYDFTVGKTLGKGSIMFSGTYAESDPVWARDREFSRYPKGQAHPTDGLSPFGVGGLITNGPDNGSYKLNDGADPTKFNSYHSYLGAPDNFNVSDQMMLASGSKRKSLFTKGLYSFNENLNAHVDALYNERTAHIQVAGYPLGTSTTGLLLDKNSYYNPLGSHSGYAAPQDVDFMRRGPEIPRITKNTVKTYRVGAGFDGGFEAGENYFNWDVSGFLNKNSGQILGTGNYDLVKMGQALGASFKDTDGVVKCGTPGSIIAGCTPLNALAGKGGWTSDMLNYISRPTNASYGSRTTGFSANISGDVVHLPAGRMQFAVGAEYRRESGYQNPDAWSQTGNSTALASLPSSGSYTTKEAYAELNIPLLVDLPFARQLSVDLASRYSRYSNFGNTTNNKAGLTWKPVDDVLVRGSYSEGFRAPTISDLYGGQSQTFDNYTDPCDASFGAAGSNATVAANCAKAGLANTFRQTNSAGVPVDGPGAQSTTPFLSGSNENLQPETSTSRSLGLIYSPHAVQGLDISVDWYRIRIENLISGVSSDNVLDDCYLRGMASACKLFQRDANGQVINLSHTLANKGWLETEGYDLAMNYRLPEFDIGQVTVHVDSNYVAKYNANAGPGAPTEFDAGNYSVWRSRTNANVDWSKGSFGVNWAVRAYSNLKEACAYDKAGGPLCDLPNHHTPGVGVTPLRTVGGVVFNDVQLRWKAPWQGVFSVGALNVLNRKAAAFYSGPASAADSEYAYNPSYDIGRFLYVRYNQKF